MTDITKLPADVASRFNEKFPGKVATFRYVGEEDIKPFVIIDKEEARQFLADELAQAKAEGVKEERNAIFKDIIEKGGFIGVQGDKEYNCDVVCRLVLDENDK